ncbi:hypothetical protein VNO77_02797 [Canavalia gladiata]|uniref:Uncharacterized protein n=1 Tax=Canavalia gladiata TaxID=3824 RepID=A0AAN9R7J8_CANGL
MSPASSEPVPVFLRRGKAFVILKTFIQDLSQLHFSEEDVTDSCLKVCDIKDHKEKVLRHETSNINLKRRLDIKDGYRPLSLNRREAKVKSLRGGLRQIQKPRIEA